MEYEYRKSFTYKGKRYEVRAQTEEELYIKKIKKIEILEQQTIIYDSKISVDIWAKKVFETYKQGTSGYADTLKRYDKYISPVIGPKSIGSVRDIECQAIMNNCAGMSFSHCCKLKQELKFIFKKAVSNQLIPFNPAADLQMPQNNRGKRRSITETERRHLLNVYKDNPQYVLFIIMLKCGCRPEEAINLIGRDIDHNERLLHIRGTKTENSDRYVPIPEDVYCVISSIKPFEPICVNCDGKKHSKSSYKRLYAHLKRDMNIDMGCKIYRSALVPPLPLADDFVPYCLRHTYCTDLCKAGVDVRTAQKLMGHANISVTADIYTHVDIEDIKNARELIEMYNSVNIKNATSNATS